MLNKRWLPLALGVPAGVLTGLWLCWQDPACHLYLASRFDRLLALQLLRVVDYTTLIFIGLFAVLQGVIAVANRYAGTVRTTLLIVLPLAVLAGAGKLFLPAHVWKTAFHLLADSRWHGSALLLLALGILLVVFYRIRTARHSRPPAPVAAPRRPWRAVQRLLPVLYGICGFFLLLFVAIQVAASLCAVQAATTMRQRPNVILIMVCSLRADHLGCYGYDRNTSPHLDQFARKSTRFAQAQAPSSWTLWSVPAILTARYPAWIFRHGDYMAGEARYPGLPSAFANLGYTTSAVSAHPLLQSDGNYPFSQGFTTYEMIPGQEFTDHTAPKVTHLALQRLTRITGRKFFQFVMFADPHAPYTPHPEFVFAPSRKDLLGAQQAASRTHPVSSREMARRQTLLTHYNSEVAYTDQAIGDYLAGLKARGLYDDTLIIICSDHGEEFLEHGSYGHQLTLYHEVTSVPLLIKFPRQTRGKVVGGTFPLLDLYPSLLAMLHQSDTHLGVQGEGTDLSVLLRCTTKPIFGATVNAARSVTVGQYKYYQARKYQRNPTNPYESGSANLSAPLEDKLFNLALDPGEYQNRWTRQPEDASTLRDLLQRHNRLLRQTAPLAGSASPLAAGDAEARQRMRTLGYLQ